MKIKLRELVESMDAMLELAKCRDIPANISFVIAENVEEINKKLSIYSDKHNDLIVKYGKDGMVSKDSEGWSMYINDNEELLDVEVDINVKKIPVKQLITPGIRLSASVFIGLKFLLEE